MRALSPRIVIVVATVLAIAGCRTSGSGWGFGRKNTSQTMSGPSEPQLPSASATPPNYGSSDNTAAAPAGGSPFADPAAQAAYQAAPYPGQPGGYPMAPPATGAPYGGTPAPAPTNYAAETTAPQQGPYAESYGQPPAGPAQAYAAGGYPTTATPEAYQPSGQPQSAPPAADPSAGAGAYVGAGAAPANPYQATPPPPGSYDAGSGGYQSADASSSAGNQGADGRYGAADPYAAQTEQSAADRYGAAGQADPSATASSTPGEPYRPGSTGYNPGQTGYSPPGVPPYQVPAQANVVSTARKNPYYRPGGTTDYTSSDAARTATAPTDRYGTPAIGQGHADPYTR